MKLFLRLPKPTKKTLPIAIEDASDQKPCLNDLIPLTINAFHLHQLQSEDIKFSLNNKDILFGDDVLLSELGIVNGDLLYLHLPESYLKQLQNELPPVIPQPPQPQPSVRTVTTKQSAAVSAEQMEISETTSTHAQGALVSNHPSPLQTDISSHIDPADYAAVQEIEELSESEVNQYLRRAMLIRDIVGEEIPHSLHTVLYKLQPSIDNQALLAVIHVIVMETGFSLKLSSSLSASLWNTPHRYMLEYIYPSPETPGFTLIAVPMAKSLLLHAVSVDSSAKYSITVKPANYVTKSQQADKHDFQFQRLPQLSREVKDKIVYPMLLHIIGDANYFVPSMENLLYEVKMMIFKYLDAQSLLQMSQTCSLFNSLCKTTQLWHRLFIKDFGKQKAKDKDPNAEWLELYKNQYILRKRIRDQLYRARVVVPPFIGRPFPLFPSNRPAPWTPSFINGGDYDRMPGASTFPYMEFQPAPRFDPIGPLPDLLPEPGRAGIYPMAPRLGSHMGRGRGRGPRMGGPRPMFF